MKELTHGPCTLRIAYTSLPLFRRWFVALYFLCYLNIRLRRTASRRSTMHRSALLRRDASYRFASRRRQLLGCVILSRYRLMNVFRTQSR